MKVILKSLTKIFMAIFLVVLGFNISQIPDTTSSLADKEKSSTNSFSAGTWGNINRSFQTENILAPSEETLGEDSAPEVIDTPGAEIPVQEPKIVTKEFNITTTGELNVPDGFTAETVEVMKTIELSGEEKSIETLKNFEINLADIKIEKEGEIDILVSDLKIPAGVELTSAKNNDVVVEITVSEKPLENNSTDIIPVP